MTNEEINGAMALVDTMAMDSLETAEFRDTDALHAVIAAKQEHREPPESQQSTEPVRLVDLVSTLRESVAKAQATRGEGARAPRAEAAKKASAMKKATAQKAFRNQLRIT